MHEEIIYRHIWSIYYPSFACDRYEYKVHGGRLILENSIPCIKNKINWLQSDKLKVQFLLLWISCHRQNASIDSYKLSGFEKSRPTGRLTILTILHSLFLYIKVIIKNITGTHFTGVVVNMIFIQPCLPQGGQQLLCNWKSLLEFLIHIQGSDLCTDGKRCLGFNDSHLFCCIIECYRTTITTTTNFHDSIT